MSSAGYRYPGSERRRHFRVEGEWAVAVDAVEDSGAVTRFEGTALNISMGGNWARFIFSEANRLGQAAAHSAFNERIRA